MSDVQVSLVGLLPMRRRLDRLNRRMTERLLDVVGSEIESQTRRRISQEKTAPDGAPWAPWSADYAVRRPAKGGILELEGHLLDSIVYEVQDDAVEVGSNLVYAAVHQLGAEEGDGGTPARPYIGLSDENARDVQALVVDFIARELGA